MSGNYQKKVLFFTPYGYWGIHNQVDAILAKAIELRGCQALVILCDGLYSDCTVLGNLGGQASQLACQACAQAGQKLFASFHLSHSQLRQFIRDEDREFAKEWVDSLDPASYARATYEGVPIGQWITSSIYTHFRITSKGLARPDVRATHCRYLVDGVITYKAFQRVIDNYNPDHIVLFNGRFAPYRVAFEVGRLHNIEITVHERGFLDDSFSFRQNAICLRTKPITDYVKLWEDIPLTSTELEAVKEYFFHREVGKDTNWNPFYTFQTEYSEVRHRLRIPENAKVVSIFTSSEDELALSEDHSGLLDQMEVLERFIKIFAERDEYLIIRHHPHIGGAGNNQAETDFIVRAYQQASALPKNVRIIMPLEQLTSYALLWNTDAAIAFFSTVSIEAAARGVPTAVFDSSSYSHVLPYVLHRNCLDIESLRGLVDRLLDSPLQAEDDLRKIYRFAYAYFFRFSQKFRSFGIANRHYSDIRIKSFEEIKPGNDSVLDRICGHILNSTPLYETPPITSSTLSKDDEDVFLNQEVQIIREQRASVRLGYSFKEEVPVRIIDIRRQQDRLLPTWQSCSRYRSLATYVLRVADKFVITEDAIHSLIDCLNRSQEDYVLIASMGIQYDESFISSAIDHLTRNQQEEWDGVWSGAWIQTPDEEIRKQIFSDSSSRLDFQQAVRILPELNHPLTLLSFVVFRRKAILQILKKLQESKNYAQASETIFRYLDDLKVYRTGLPMIVVHQAQLQELLFQNELSVEDRKLEEPLTLQSVSERSVVNPANEDISSESCSSRVDYPTLNVLIFWPSAGQLAPPVIVSQNEVFCEPNCQPFIEDNRIRKIRIPTNPFDVSEIVDRLPQAQKPELVIVHQDASKRGLPLNLRKLSCPTVLMLGDTHHLNAPIKTLLEYAIQENFDYITTEYNRQHLHYFQEAGFENTAWLPGFHAYFCDRQLQQQSRKYPISFVGRVGFSHPYRQYVLQQVKAWNFPIHITQVPQVQASEIYSNTLINLNVSLNGDLNQRIFEVLSSGGFLITDDLSSQSGLSVIFQEGVHFATFKNEQDLREKILHFMSCPEEAEEIACKGHDWVWENYSHPVNANRLVNYVQQRIIDPIYKAQDGRIYSKHLGSTPLLRKRVALYELVQEIHRQKVYPRLVFWDIKVIDKDIIQDLLDLPRLEMYKLATCHWTSRIGSILEENFESVIHPISSVDILKNGEVFENIFLNGSHLEKLSVSFFRMPLKAKVLIVADWVDLNADRMGDLIYQLQGSGFEQHHAYPQCWQLSDSVLTPEYPRSSTSFSTIQSLRRKVKEHPYNITSYVQLGKYLESQGRSDLGMRAYSKAIELST